MQAQVGRGAGIASVCAHVLCKHLTEACDRWGKRPYCIPWTWVAEGAWAKTYRCVRWLRRMLDCVPCVQSLPPIVKGRGGPKSPVLPVAGNWLR